MNQVEEILEEHVLHVLKKQKAKKKHIPVDLVMQNGNILLSQFRLHEYDKKLKQIKGLTHREEYSHPREDRDPVYCYLYLKEISNLYCPDLGIDYPSGYLTMQEVPSHVHELQRSTAAQRPQPLK